MRNRVLSVAVLACFLGASLAMADVTITQRKAARAEKRAAKKAAHRNAKKSRAPKAEKTAKRRARPERPGRTQGTGGITLIDSSGLEWSLNTDLTFSTSSSASGAMSEASYTTSHAGVTTSLGGTTTSTLDDAYDGYQAMCVSLDGGTGPCESGGGGGARTPVRERKAGSGGTYVMYNQTGGPPVADASCNNRQYVFPILTTSGLQMQRKVFVPSTDSFARWLNIFTNTTGAPITFNMITSNNLGSDSNTLIVTSSNGNASAEITDTWLTSFQDYSGGTSGDPRLGHVFQGAAAPVPLSGISFADGDDNPFWRYTITLAPGQTKIIMNFGVAQLTKAAAATKSAQLATLALPSATACMSGTELSQLANFNAQAIDVPTVGPVGLALLGLALALIGFVVVRRLI